MYFTTIVSRVLQILQETKKTVDKSKCKYFNDKFYISKCRKLVNTNIPPKQGHSGRLQLLQLKYNSCKRTSDARLAANWPLHNAARRDTILISHTRTVVRECCKGDDASQWETGNSTPCHPKPLNRSSQKVAHVITSWISTDMQNLVAIPPGGNVGTPYTFGTNRDICFKFGSDIDDVVHFCVF